MMGFFNVTNAASLCAALLMAALPMQAAMANDPSRNVDSAGYEIVYPKTNFDPAEAAAMLGEGTTTIEGNIFNTLDITGRSLLGLFPHQRSKMGGLKIYLYPATQHFVEWEKKDARQRSKFNDAPIVKLVNIGKRPKVYKFDDRVLSHRLETTSDQNGNFSFSKLLPGKYYVYSQTRVEGSFMGTEVVGRTTYTNGYGQVVAVGDETQPKEHFWFRNLEVRKYIEVKADQSKIEENLKLK